MYKYCFKRILDLILATVAIVVLSIPMLVIAIIIKINSPGPAIFKQRRVGIHKTEFTMLKFRSMPIDSPNNLATRDFNEIHRLNKLQRFIRKTSIDELPQLFNIWIGHMSLVGPRPVLSNESDLIAERDKYGANDIKPGLTGWAQVNGRDELDIVEKARYDGEYVQKMSFVFDFKCLLKTVSVVLKSKGIVEGEEEKKNQPEKEEASRS